MQPRIDRRTLLKTFGSTAAVLLAAACAPAAAPSPAPKTELAPAAPPPAAPAAPAAGAPKPTAASAAAPQASTAVPARSAGQGDRVVVAVPQWGTETPFAWRIVNNEFPLWSPIYDELIFHDPKTFEFKPGLATAWDHSPDYKTWTFKLRQGVMFHGDNGEFTSDDLRFMVDQHSVPGAQGGAVGQIKTIFDHVETPDKYTFVVHTKVPSWEVPAIFSQYTGYQHVTSRKYVEAVGEEKAAQNPVGTGPFRHVEGQQGAFHRFEAVPNHWRRTPGFKELVIRRIPDPATRLAGIRSGEIDIGSVFGDYLVTAQNAGLRIFELPNATQYWIIITGQTTPDRKDYCPKCPWFGDPSDPKSQENARNVRLALNLAINKQAIVDGLWHGKGNLGPFGYFYYPFNKGFSENWKIPPYDPAKAKQLLAQAGYPNGFEVSVNPMVGLYSPDGPDVMEAVALDWEKVGIKVKREPEDYGSFVAKVRARDTGPRFWPYSGSPFDEPAEVWSKNMHTKASMNQLPEGPFDPALDAIAQEVDTDKRAKLEQDLAQRLYDGYYEAMIGWKTVTWAVSRKVGTWDLLPVPFESNYETITWTGQ